MKRFSIIFLLSSLAFFPSEGVMSQNTAPNPLETPIDSPYLPKIDRALTPLELNRLNEYIETRDKEAEAKYNADANDEAFAIWYEVIKLNRAIGPEREVKSLGRVGLAAWNKNRTEDVKLITARLQNIQKQAETEKTLTPSLLLNLAGAYESVRAFDNALILYNRILDSSRKAGDKTAIEANLNKVGELHLVRFDYSKAAPVYEELLTIARGNGDSLRKGIYLQRLAEIYRNSLQAANAVRIKEQQIDNLLKNKQLAAVPPLRVEIGLDYQTLKDPNKASQNFQEAYSLAFALQQYGTAGDALNRLADLYKSYGQIDYALKIYRELIKVQELAYNYYGLMNTYDSIGQIYLDRKDYRGAMEAFQKGSELARAIRHREEYFQTRIAGVNQAINTPAPPAQPQPR